MNKGSSVNRLSMAQAHKLIGWMEDNWGRIEQEGLTQPQAATEASRELGFRVTRGNMLQIPKQLGKPWPNGRGPVKAKQAQEVEGKLLFLEAELVTLRARVDGLTALLKGFGAEDPPNRPEAYQLRS